MKSVKPEFMNPIQGQVRKLFDTLKETNTLWDQIYEGHSKNAVILLEGGHGVHLSFYRFMQEISIECNENPMFFDNLVEEFKIARANERFDITFTTELKESADKILKNLKIKRSHSEEI